MSKNITIDNLQISFEEYGEGKNTIILLHGWGQSQAFWNNFPDNITGKYHMYAIDLPGFGKSDAPSHTWTIMRYAEFVHQFNMKLSIKNPILIGHSFGGRIAIAYASRFPIKKLVLYSTGGGLPEQSLVKKFYRHFFIKMGKYVFPNLLYTSHLLMYKPKEYTNRSLVTKNRSRRMLDIYTQPEEDLRDALQHIQVKTLIISGGRDFIAGTSTGKLLHQRMNRSTLLEIADATHFAHLETPEVFYRSLNRFLQAV